MPEEPTTLQQTECDWQILGTFLILLIDSFSSFISRLLLACFILWPFLLATTVCKHSPLQIPNPELSNFKLGALQVSEGLVSKVQHLHPFCERNISSLLFGML